MNKLTQILTAKRTEVEAKKLHTKISDFEASSYYNRIGKSLKNKLQKEAGIIAEYKRSSPSEGEINANAGIQTVIRGYEKAGAAAISVLTDQAFFGGSLEDLVKARQITELPLLRKDFIVDEFQIHEAKANGADLILLIAEALETDEVAHFAELAKSLHLEVLLEVHSEAELAKVNEFVDLVGVNNRDLTTFEVSLDTSKQLANLIPSEFVKISESGYTDPKDVYDINQYGYQGFLIGSHFMKQENPAEAAKDFISKLT